MQIRPFSQYLTVYLVAPFALNLLLHNISDDIQHSTCRQLLVVKNGADLK